MLVQISSLLLIRRVAYAKRDKFVLLRASTCEDWMAEEIFLPIYSTCCRLCCLDDKGCNNYSIMESYARANSANARTQNRETMAVSVYIFVEREERRPGNA